MKRDMYVIQTVLEHFKKSDKAKLPTKFAPPAEIRVLCTEDDYEYHIMLCVSVGYLELERNPGQPDRAYMTWKGHDALEEIRKPRAGDTLRELAKSEKPPC